MTDPKRHPRGTPASRGGQFAAKPHRDPDVRLDLGTRVSDHRRATHDLEALDVELNRVALADDEATCQVLLKRESLPRQAMLLMSKSAHESVRRGVAHHSSTDASILDSLAGDPDCELLVAENHNTSSETLHRLAQTGMSMTRVAVAANTKTYHADIERLAHTEGAMAREAAAGNLSSPEHLLRHLYVSRSEGDQSTRRTLAGNMNTPPDLLSEMSNDTDTATRQAVAGNAAIYRLPDVAERLAHDPNLPVRLALARNTSTPTTIGMVLKTDRDWQVREAAWDRHPARPSDESRNDT